MEAKFGLTIENAYRWRVESVMLFYSALTCDWGNIEPEDWVRLFEELTEVYAECHRIPLAAADEALVSMLTAIDALEGTNHKKHA